MRAGDTICTLFDLCYFVLSQHGHEKLKIGCVNIHTNDPFFGFQYQGVCPALIMHAIAERDFVCFEKPSSVKKIVFASENDYLPRLSFDNDNGSHKSQQKEYRPNPYGGRMIGKQGH